MKPRPADPAPQLLWNAKESLHRYVVSSGGTRELISPAHSTDDTLTFPARSGGVARNAFSGGVVFRAHAGALHIRFEQPEVVTDQAGQRQLAVIVDGGAVALASLENVVETEGRICAIPYLRLSGVDVFGGFYPVGTPLDELRLEW